MTIQKSKMPLIDGKTYYLPVIFDASIDPMIEGGGYFSTPGGHCLILNKESVRALLEEVSPTKRCRDCAHAQQSPTYARNVYCKYRYPGCSWNKMCAACEHYEPRKEQK